MTHWKRVGILSVVLLIAPGVLFAASDGFTLQDAKLETAGALVDACSVEPGHGQYDVARAFCYGFFEGAIRFDEAISGGKNHRDLVCAPAGTTRLEAVEVFVSYMKANPQYMSEGPIDALYRALMPRWPCAK
jgi:hypothetical protein